MMFVDVEYRGTVSQVILYDVWDIADKEVVLPNLVLSEDVGKYVLFTDGTNVLTKLVHKTARYFNTTAGVFYRYDYVTVCRPKTKSSGYSGLRYCDEHFKVRHSTKNEREIAEKFISKQLPSTYPLSKRCRMLIIDKMQDTMKESGIDEKYIVSKLKKEVDSNKNRGADRIEAIKLLARIGGVEIGGMNTLPQKNTPLFAQFNTFTIQDHRRNMIDIPNRRELEKVIEISVEDSQQIQSVEIEDEA